jgi:hypothetical protein
VTWSFQGSPPRTIAIEPAPLASCRLNYNRGTIDPVADGGADELSGIFSVRCHVPEVGGDLTINVSDLGDFRAWQPGTFTTVAPLDGLVLEYRLDTSTDAAPCDLSAYFEGIALTVTVETAIGGPAPYPKLVTDDFVRTFRLAFDTSSVPATWADGTACDVPWAVQASFHLTQTAGDYVYDADALCICG